MRRIPPRQKDAYKNALDKSQWIPIDVPEMRNYPGGIRASWYKHGPSFLEHTGDFALSAGLTPGK